MPMGASEGVPQASMPAGDASFDRRQTHVGRGARGQQVGGAAQASQLVAQAAMSTKYFGMLASRRRRNCS